MLRAGDRLPVAEREALVVFADRDLIVLDKPIQVHSQPDAARGGNSLVDALARRKVRTWVVHRLDFDTSGLIAYALSPGAASALAAVFRHHEAQRRYRALIAAPLPVGASGTIDAPIATSGGRSRVGDGERAVTHWSVEGTSAVPGTTALTLRLETGRTHQIRVHLAHALGPVLGDTKYGGPPWPRLALHAAELGLPHPRTGEWGVFHSAPPWESA